MILTSFFFRWFLCLLALLSHPPSWRSTIIKVLLSKNFRLHFFAIRVSLSHSLPAHAIHYTAILSVVVFWKLVILSYNVHIFGIFAGCGILIESFSRHIDVWFAFHFFFIPSTIFACVSTAHFTNGKFGILMWSKKDLGDSASKTVYHFKQTINNSFPHSHDKLLNSLCIR